MTELPDDDVTRISPAAMSRYEELRRFQHNTDIPTLPLRLRLTTQTFNQVSNEELQRSVGISLPRFVVLATLDAVPGLTGALLAELTGQRPQSLTDAVNALEHEGLLERRPGHGRARLHYLTDAGRALLAPARAVTRRIHDRATSGMSREEVIALERALTKVQDNLAEK